MNNMENYELISEWGNIYRDGGKALKIYSSETPYDYVNEEKITVKKSPLSRGLFLSAYYFKYNSKTGTVTFGLTTGSLNETVLPSLSIE